MAEKVLNSRIINKHDIAANWELAVNFIPKSGEIIVYEPDGTTPYARLKVGDGTTRVDDLDFLSEQEFSALRNDLNALGELVGDTSVADQISEALEEVTDLVVTFDDSLTASHSASEIITAINANKRVALKTDTAIFPYVSTDGWFAYFHNITLSGSQVACIQYTIDDNKKASGSIYKYEYTLPTASSTTLGGVMPVAKTEEMTQVVGVDAEGRLFTNAPEVKDIIITYNTSTNITSHSASEIEALVNEGYNVEFLYNGNKIPYSEMGNSGGERCAKFSSIKILDTNQILLTIIEVTESKIWFASFSQQTLQVDKTLSLSYTPAEAKAVGDALAGKQPVGDYAVREELNNYVAKEEGKGLSSNDYTTAEKQKLESLTVMTEITNAEIDAICGATIVSGSEVNL